MTSVTTRKGGIPAEWPISEKKADFQLEKYQKIFVLGTWKAYWLVQESRWDLGFSNYHGTGGGMLHARNWGRPCST